MTGEIRQDRQAIEEAGLYRQAILDSMVDGLVTLDLNGRIHTFNNAACRMMGRDPEAPRPQTLSELLGTQLPLNAQGHLELLSTVDGIEGASAEVNGRHANGAIRPISVSASRIPHTEHDTFVVMLRGHYPAAPGRRRNPPPRLLRPAHRLAQPAPVDGPSAPGHGQ